MVMTRSVCDGPVRSPVGRWSLAARYPSWLPLDTVY